MFLYFVDALPLLIVPSSSHSATDTGTTRSDTNAGNGNGNSTTDDSLDDMGTTDDDNGAVGGTRSPSLVGQLAGALGFFVALASMLA